MLMQEISGPGMALVQLKQALTQSASMSYGNKYSINET